MSTAIKTNLISATILLAIFFLNFSAYSQSIEAKIKIVSAENSEIKIEGKFLGDNNLIEKNWVFLQGYADAENLGKRIDNLQLFDEKEREIPYKKFAEGEFVTDKNAKAFSYSVEAKVSQNLSSNAHISWINKTYGLLMLNDLFPEFKGENIAMKLTFELPNNWKISSAEEKVETNTFFVKDLEDAVFWVGENSREKEVLVNRTQLKFIILDKWQFEDEIAFEMATEIISEYAELFGDIPVKKAQIILMNFPGDIERNRWRAETRGTNITILSSEMLSENLAIQRLHEQLRHEIFHLWIPNSLNLSGDYAWFYEGFAIYQALKTGVWLGQISFDDYLNTLEQGYFLSQKRSVESSLINISNMRWNGDISSVYVKGLLVAFLCDVALLERSKGKRNLKTIFQELYKKHKKLNKNQSANISVLNVLQEYEELAPIIQKYIKGNEKINWTNYISALGIENTGSNLNANLKVKSKLSGSEKTLLKKLGYNRRRNFIKQKVIRNVN